MPAPRAGDAHRGQLFPAPRHRDQITATMTTNPPPDARNARIYVATANVAVMDILSGREHLASALLGGGSLVRAGGGAW